MKLLAVQESENGNSGSIADLYLETQDGEGRVFIDTYPLTKFDTQISTRYAQDIACDILNEQCLDKDFIYTIKAGSVIIAGPSAGAAIAALTIAELLDLKVDQSVSVTGTINSGGLIGPVGGLKEKIEAAASNGLSKVLIPQRNETNKTNENISIDLVEYGKEIGIEVVVVYTINNVLLELTGVSLSEDKGEIEISSKYQSIMKKLAVDLCDRASLLKKEFDSLEKPENEGYNSSESTLLIEIKNLLNKSEIAHSNEKYYSAASFCFGINAKLAYLNALKKNLSQEELKSKIEDMGKDIENIENEINNIKKITISDLEAFAAVRERVIEAKAVIEEAKKNETEIDIYQTIYAGERIYSAKSWQSFFDFGGKKIDLSKESLRSSCLKKVEEADERYQYVKYITSIDLLDTQKGIQRALQDLENGEYELCLFKASKAKAETDVILNLIGVNQDRVEVIADRKLQVVKNEIITEIQEGSYPIIGSSYYEYAKVLQEQEDYNSALIYAEYALELSNIGMYFEKENSDNMAFAISSAIIIGIVALGFLLINPKDK